MKILIKSFVLGLVMALFFSSVSVASTLASIASSESVQFAPWGRTSYYFGRVLVNSYNSVRYDVTNTGDQPLSFVDAVIYGIYFDARHNCNRTLEPGQKCRFDITYWPSFQGYHSGEFILRFDKDFISVNLLGDAVNRY